MAMRVSREEFLGESCCEELDRSKDKCDAICCALAAGMVLGSSYKSASDVSQIVSSMLGVDEDEICIDQEKTLKDFMWFYSNGGREGLEAKLAKQSNEVDKADLLALAAEFENEARELHNLRCMISCDPNGSFSESIKINLERAERIRKACGVGRSGLCFCV